MSLSQRLGLFVALLAAATAGAADAGGPRAPGVRGEGEYRKYCASCHGLDGRGRGDMADVLRKPPADLTRLGERYGLPLPRPKLLAFVDGRRELGAHGTREMPVWGERLFEDVPSRTPEARKRGSMLVILDYIETLQRRRNAGTPAAPATDPRPPASPARRRR